VASQDFRDSQELTGYLETMVIPADLDQRVIRVHKDTLDLLASLDRGESRATLAREVRESESERERRAKRPRAALKDGAARP